MKLLRTCRSCLRGSLSKIHLVDKCLIAFMLFLLIQSSFTLFTDHTVTSETNQIDVIVRTSMAAIFGYFLSANFIRHEPRPESPPTTAPPQSVSGHAEGPQARIGFAAAEEDAQNPPQQPTPPQLESPPRDETTASRLQILVATGIGLFCMLVLTIVRNIPDLSAEITASPSTQATVAQFRDIVSGCVGFLIGCPTTKANR